MSLRMKPAAGRQIKKKSRSRALNPEQAEAVARVHGPLLILAGAGSGKTTVITERVVQMLAEGIPSSAIVAVTFTNKSAREMRTRLEGLTGRPALRGMVVSTFHSLGHRILSHEIEHLPGFRKPYSIMPPDDLENVLSDIYREFRLDPSSIKADGTLFWISLCKNSGQPPALFAEDRNLNYEPDLFERIFRRYEEALRSMNAVDFDDLLLLPLRLLRSKKQVLEKYRRRWRYFLVDEYQDTNPVQYELMRLLVGEPGNLCVVGDDDQAIYGWRGADVGIILGFERDYPRAHVVRLETNYRSTGQILEAANAVIAHNQIRVQKRMRATAGNGPPLRAAIGADEEREAQIIADRIEEAMVREKLSPADFAILYRTNFQSRAFEQELRKRNIPHHVVGGYRFFDRREVRDLIGYLRAIANPADEVALSRIINRPRRGIGDTTWRKIGEYMNSRPVSARGGLNSVLEDIESEPGLLPGVRPDTIAAMHAFLELLRKYRKEFTRTRPLAQVLAALISELNFESEFRREGDNDRVVRARMLNLSELTNMLAFFEDNHEGPEPPGLFEFLARLSLLAQDQDSDDPRGRVQLLTFHLSKGLEFPVVFLTGLEEGVFPAPRSIEESESALDEERRLFYVGITRARKELWLTGASSRRRFGERIQVEPSRFLDELPENCLEWVLRETEGDGQNTLTDLLSGLSLRSGGDVG